MNRLFGHQMAISSSLFIRILAFGILVVFISIIPFLNLFPIPHIFYPGWDAVHRNWTPVAVSAAEWHTQGTLAIFSVAWDEWIGVWVSVAAFGLFGLTLDARRTYVGVFRGVAGWPGEAFARCFQDRDPTLPRHRQNGVLKLSSFRHVI